MPWRNLLVASPATLTLLVGCGDPADSNGTLSYSTSVEPGALTIAVAGDRPERRQ